MIFTDEDFPADPYPGARPETSFVHIGGRGYALPDTLDVDGRVPVLAYGSNACPSKVTWLRENLGLPGEVVVLRARCTGIAAVWAAGFRARDGQRTATLTAMPGVTETHAVWLATPEQLAVLDICEGRGKRYHLARLSGAVVLEDLDGSAPRDVFAYVGANQARMPLLVDGRPVRLAESPQAEAIGLAGIAAPSHGLDAVIV
ncbi:gamma-glutamylcyclotransferase [Amycolatopsis pigmentata]|uniref:Gamma-glutamylcyclotransferase n=1 Tax=Amycolatopsis pigmentata TaxID=450801 RepID=A0ABW5FU60_9PSEU